MYQNGFVVAVKINNKTVNESGGKVVVPFGSEYSLMLKNRNDRKAVARVYIDGEEVTKTGKLILDSNSSLNLERYVDNMNEGAKFKFVPLSDNRVHDKGDSEKGFIEVRFQLIKPTQNQVVIHEEHIYRHHHHDFYDDYPYWKKYPNWPNYPIWIDQTPNTKYLCSGGTCASSQSQPTNSNHDCEQQYYNARIEHNSLVEEAGATIKGSNSNQKFSYSYVGELEAQETTIRFQLVGTKDETVVAQYLKTHCVECGKKYESNDNFCSKCGIKK